ncbi:NADH-quinone oxidoreductase subunit J [bacterium]|nr:NADH-quinone oxidoreductase subunit J [bacterium]
MELAIFIVLAVLAISSAVVVITQKSPVYSVLALVSTFFALAGIYVLLNAYFLAMIQIAVYAGAIMVLFLFVVMLLNLKEQYYVENPKKIIGGVLGLAFVFALLFPIFEIEKNLVPESQMPVGDAYNIGIRLFTDYVFPFEIASIILLIATVGAIVFTKKHS